MEIDKGINNIGEERTKKKGEEKEEKEKTERQRHSCFITQTNDAHVVSVRMWKSTIFTPAHGANTTFDVLSLRRRILPYRLFLLSFDRSVVEAIRASITVVGNILNRPHSLSLSHPLPSCNGQERITQKKVLLHTR